MATQIPLDKIIDNPFQSRSQFNDASVRSLADEMKAEGFWSGVLQGRRTKNGTIELVFGHRRLRALKLLGRDTIPIEIVDLTDSQMALRSLEENLQREGLTDLEKADAVKQAIKIEETELKAAGNHPSHAIKHIADRLGLSVSWVSELNEISSAIAEKIRRAVEAGYITAKVAFRAKDWGGEAYALTLADQGKRAKQDGSVPLPTQHTLTAMRKVVDQASEPIRDKLKAAIVAGEITTAKEAEQKGRRLAAERTKRNKNPPEDLATVLVGWTHRLEDWTTQLKDVVPYVEYLDEVPAIAKPFREALKEFIVTAQTLLEDEPVRPRAAGRGQSTGAASKLRKRLTA